MKDLLVDYIRETQERNPEAIATVFDEDTAVINHNVGNYTLEYIDASGGELKRQHISFDQVKHMAALVDLHYALNRK